MGAKSGYRKCLSSTFFPKQKRRVCSATVRVIIFKVNKLGDNVVFLPVVQMIRQIRPDWRLLIVTSPVASPLYNAERSGNQLIEVEKETFRRLYHDPLKFASVLHTLRKFGPTHCLFASDQPNAAYLLGLLSRASSRIGRVRPFQRVPGAINRPEPFDPTASPALDGWKLMHRLLENTDGPMAPESPRRPDLSHLCSTNTASSVDLILHPGSSVEYKRWPLENFVSLANRLSIDKRVGWIAAEHAPDSLDPSVQIIQSRTLSDLVSAIRQARLFIGNNSGPYNVAVALGVPSVIVNAASARNWDPIWSTERFRMLRDESIACLPCENSFSKCLNPRRMQCLERWTVERVQTEVELWWERWGKSSGAQNVGAVY